MADQDKGALFNFLDYAAQKNLMRKGTAQSLKSACSAVFSALDDEEQKDIFALDLEQVFRRFENARYMEVTPSTMRTYRQRVRQAVRDFRRFKDDPTNWKPSRAQHQARTKAKVSVSDDAHAQNDAHTSKESDRKEQPVADPVQSVPPEAIVHRFPVRRDATVQISGIPFDITKSEMGRMTAFLSNLVVPDPDDSEQTPLMLNVADKEST